jgi:hypothetical protein
MKKEYESSGDGTFEDLRAEGKFLEAFIYAWGMVESYVDMSILYEFGMLGPETKANQTKVEYLQNGSFNRKTALLKDVGEITTQENETLMKFAKKRNELVHGRNFNIRFHKLSDDERFEYLNLASNALRISLLGLA